MVILCGLSAYFFSLLWVTRTVYGVLEIENHLLFVRHQCWRLERQTAALFSSPLSNTSQGWASECWHRGPEGNCIGAHPKGLFGIAAVTAGEEMNSGT